MDLARRVALKSGSGEKPGNIYLASQVDTIKGKLSRKEMTPAGSLSACQHVMENVTKKLRSDEIDRSDADWRRAVQELKELATEALSHLEDNSEGEPVHAIGDSVAPALKSERRNFWDAVDEDRQAGRDPFGRRIRG